MKLKDKAFNWAVDYKPFSTELEYRSYAEYGYEQGYLRAIRDILKEHRLELEKVEELIEVNTDKDQIAALKVKRGRLAFLLHRLEKYASLQK